MVLAKRLQNTPFRKNPAAISSRRFWFSTILLLLCIALLVARFIQIQLVDPVPFRLNECRVETVPRKETLR